MHVCTHAHTGTHDKYDTHVCMHVCGGHIHTHILSHPPSLISKNAITLEQIKIILFEDL